MLRKLFFRVLQCFFGKNKQKTQPMLFVPGPKPQQVQPPPQGPALVLSQIHPTPTPHSWLNVWFSTQSCFLPAEVERANELCGKWIRPFLTRRRDRKANIRQLIACPSWSLPPLILEPLPQAPHPNPHPQREHSTALHVLICSSLASQGRNQRLFPPFYGAK